MDITTNFENIRKILLNPVSGWQDIEVPKTSLKSFFSKHVLFILSIVFVARFLGESFKLLPVSSMLHIFTYSLLSFVWEILALYTSIYVINLIISGYNVTKSNSISNVTYLVYYSLIPYYFSVALVTLFPSMYFFAVITVYGFVLFWFGLKHFFKFTNDDLLIFYIISSILIIGVHLVLRFIVVEWYFQIF